MSYSIARSMSSLLELETLRREDLEAYIEARMERGEHGGV